MFDALQPPRIRGVVLTVYIVVVFGTWTGHLFSRITTQTPHPPLRAELQRGSVVHWEVGLGPMPPGDSGMNPAFLESL